MTSRPNGGGRFPASKEFLSDGIANSQLPFTDYEHERRFPGALFLSFVYRLITFRQIFLPPNPLKGRKKKLAQRRNFRHTSPPCGDRSA